ncbi:hypothetical protein EJ08DRAFT_425094 [Tothia fuscella]|uniref:CUE domain-containing protein n=1 Tax=Tothia fuscella TaxID=1048955 RepID=A0A9P4U343_9PEZI|nr:hypothetical protein EJ08DRAFT_425094 [Tothia fuscella]
MSDQRPHGQQQEGGLNSNPWEGEQTHLPHNYSSVPPVGGNTPNPWDEGGQQHNRPQQPYNQNTSDSYQNQYQQHQDPYQNHPQHHQDPSRAYSYQPPQNAPPQRQEVRTVDLVPENERGEQFETMQNYEMQKNKPDSQEDLDVATLQKEFPGMDGSLIAAIYGDSKSLGATRELLQALV